jgi:predicted RNase H-like HicB family nuclease
VRVVVHVRKGRSGQLLAFCPDLPGCSATAPTLPEALALLRRRIAEGLGRTVEPAPPDTQRIVIDV